MAWVANWIASIAKESAFAGLAVSSNGGKSVAKTYVNLLTYLHPGGTTYVLLRTTYVVLRTYLYLRNTTYVVLRSTTYVVLRT